MSPPYVRHVFVCTNRRPDGVPKGCCASKGSEELRNALKREVGAQNLVGVRVNAAGCLDACERGVSIVVYPEGVWYGGATLDDVKEIVENLKKGEVCERLRMALPIQKSRE